MLTLIMKIAYFFAVVFICLFVMCVDMQSQRNMSFCYHHRIIINGKVIWTETLITVCRNGKTGLITFMQSSNNHKAKVATVCIIVSSHVMP